MKTQQPASHHHKTSFPNHPQYRSSGGGKVITMHTGENHNTSHTVAVISLSCLALLIFACVLFAVVSSNA
jgi:hypothetical protein